MKRNHSKTTQNTAARTRQIAVDELVHREFSASCKAHGYRIGARASKALRRDLDAMRDEGGQK